jgi:hypothetical protein
MASLSIELDDGTLDLVDETRVSIRVRYRDGDLSTVWARRFPGVESDYLDTLVSDVVRAWSYGERQDDIVRAANHVARHATRHRRAHEQGRI